jgi:GTP pyrophosphokinase
MKQAYNAMRKQSDDGGKEKVDAILKEEENKVSFETDKIDKKGKYQLIEKNLQKNFVVLTCCNPLPGDDAFGFITDEEEVAVHRSSCEVGLKLKSHFGDRVIEIAWGDYKQYTFTASIAFTGIDKQGILKRIIAKISEDTIVNILGMNISSKDGIFEGNIEVNVHSIKDVQNLCSIIAKVDGINTVHRSTT